MLYLENNGTFTPWSGERIGGISHPSNIENLWSDFDLAVWGLYKPEAADEIPEGKIVSGITVQRVNGVVKYVNTLVDAPLVDRVTARQFKLALLAMGYLDAVEAWIATQSRAVQIAFEYSGTFVKDEPMMLLGFQGLGFTQQQIDIFFENAAQI